MLLLLLLCNAMAYAQDFKVIDNKGTFRNITRNDVTTATTAPTSPVEGDVWFDTTTNNSKIYDGSSWIIIDDDTVTESATAPTTPVQGDIWFDTTNAITKVWDGSAWQEIKAVSALSLWDKDEDTGIQVEESADEDKIRFDTAGSERLILDENGRLLFANSGDFDNSGGSPTSAVLGIDGTTHGRLRLTAGSQDTFSDTEGASIDLHANSATSNTGVLDLVAGQAASGANAAIKFWTNSSGGVGGQATRAVITGNGDVGINTTSPTQKLDVRGSARIDEWIYDENNERGTAGQVLSSTATGIDWIDVSAASTPSSITDADSDTKIQVEESADEDKIRFDTAGTERMIIDETGNVGIGISTPEFETHIEDGSLFVGDITYATATIPAFKTNIGTANGHRLVFDNSFNGTAGSGMAANKIVLHNNNWLAGFGVESSSVTYHSGAHHTFYSGSNNTSYGNQRMIIQSNGNVGIGTSTPTEELEVNGTVDAKAYKSDVYTARRTTNFTTWSGNQMRDFPNLTQTITLTEEATVLMTYNISMPGGNSHLVTRLMVGNNVRSKSISGNVAYWHVSATWYETLAAGTHTIKVQYRTPRARTLTPSQDWQDAYLQVVVLGNQ